MNKITPMSNEGHTTAKEPVLVMATPGRMRDSLRALLRTIPWVQLVGQADSSSSALRLIGQHHPKLVLLDAGLPNNQAWTLLKLIETEYPQTHSIVLADNFSQQKAARSAGADVALLKGFALSELFVAMETLLFGRKPPLPG